jgi:hypothetical protein
MSVIAFRSSVPRARHRPIPTALVRDLVAVGLITEERRPSAWHRVEKRVGRETVAAVRALLIRDDS